MLALFRTNQLLVGFLLIFYAGLLHIAAFVNPVDWQPLGYGVWSEWVYATIGASSFWPNITAMVLLTAHAIFINVLMANHRLADNVTNLPGLFYILIASALPEFLHLSPLLMANTFYLIALSELLKVYRNPSCPDTIFNVGFWIAIGSFFYPSYLIFTLFGLIGMNSLRAFRLREWLMLIAGAVVPYILLGVYFFWFDQLNRFIATQFYDNFAFLDFQKYTGNEFYFKLAFVDLFLLVAIFSSNLYVFKKIMEVQKKISVLYLALFISGFTLFFQADIQLDHFLIVAVPLGMMISINFEAMNKQWAEALHLLILLLIFFFQFQQFILPS